MTYFAPRDKDEDNAAIREAYKASFMSDTKWRKVFATLEAADSELQIVIKWVGVDDERHCRLPNIETPRPWADFIEWGPSPLRSIEWLEVRRQKVERRLQGYPEVRTPQAIDALRSSIGGLGRLPVEDTPDGFRVVGYVAK